MITAVMAAGLLSKAAHSQSLSGHFSDQTSKAAFGPYLN